ncbi:hypothetical protein A2U01_0093606, partial [Trifolium medium]|nr:hypothetical protein [Trifolium medium]
TVSEHSESAEKDNNADLNVFDLDNLNSGESPAEKTPDPIAKRLRSNSGKHVVTASEPVKTPKKGKKSYGPKKQ